MPDIGPNIIESLAHLILITSYGVSTLIISDSLLKKLKLRGGAVQATQPLFILPCLGLCKPLLGFAWSGSANKGCQEEGERTCPFLLLPVPIAMAFVSKDLSSCSTRSLLAASRFRESQLLLFVSFSPAGDHSCFLQFCTRLLLCVCCSAAPI